MMSLLYTFHADDNKLNKIINNINNLENNSIFLKNSGFDKLKVLIGKRASIIPNNSGRFAQNYISMLSEFFRYEINNIIDNYHVRITSYMIIVM